MLDTKCISIYLWDVIRMQEKYELSNCEPSWECLCQPSAVLYPEQYAWNWGFGAGWYQEPLKEAQCPVKLKHFLAGFCTSKCFIRVNRKLELCTIICVGKHFMLCKLIIILVQSLANELHHWCWTIFFCQNHNDPVVR